MSIFKNNPFFSTEEKETPTQISAPPPVPSTWSGMPTGPTIINSFGNNGGQSNAFGTPTFPSGQPMQFQQPQPVATTQYAAPDSVAKFVSYFSDLLKNTKLPGSTGPDYHEFMATFQSMLELGLPEDKVYQAAWKALKSSNPNLTLQTLVNSASQYLQLLENDKAISTAKIDGQIKSEVDNLNADIQKMQQEIADCQAKITANSNSILEKQQQINERSFKLTNNKNGYLTAFDQVSTQIKTDIQKIPNYIHE